MTRINAPVSASARIAFAGVALLIWTTASRADLIPAPTSGAMPTISSSVTHAEPGDAVMVSGSGHPSAAASSIRVAWLLDGVTTVAAEVPVTAGNVYATTLTVPTAAPEGPAKLCATLGAAMDVAEFACVPFTIDPPTPGEIEGQLPSAGGEAPAVSPFANTLVNVVDRLGNIVASTTPASDGSFALAGIRPGTYTLTPAGVMPVVARAAPVTVSRIEKRKVVLKPIGKPKRSDCVLEDTLIVPNLLNMTPSARGPDNSTFGVYVSGVTANVTISARVAFGSARTGVRGAPPLPPADLPISLDYEITKPDRSTVRIPGHPVTTNATFNVGTLPPGISTITTIVKLHGAECTNLKFQRSINVIPNPLGDVLRGAITFVNHPSNAEHYDISAIIPYDAHLPFRFPEDPPDIPLIGPFRNEFDVGVRLFAELRLDGTLVFKLLDAYGLLAVLNQDVFNEYVGVQQSDDGETRLNILDLRRASFNVPRRHLIGFGPYRVTPYAGPVFSLWGVLNVNAGVSLGISGDLAFESEVFPLVPAVRTRLLPSVAPELGVRVWVDLLLLVAAGADGRATVRLTVPLRVDIDPERGSNPFDVALEDPCLALGVMANVWVRLGIGWFAKEFSGPDISIVLPGIPITPIPNPGPLEIGNCDSLRAAALRARDVGDTLLRPRLLASPAVATSTDGDVLEVHVEDAATSGVALPKIMARFRDPGTVDWGPSTALTDGSHMVHDPVVAFTGTGATRTAIVVWTEAPITLGEDTALGEDVAGFQNRQEIYYATWQGGLWSAPARLTNDVKADGRASIAGDAFGATLAWVRDYNGDFATRTDWRIAVSDWNGSGFGTPVFLNRVFGARPCAQCDPYDAPSIHAQPSVARRGGRVAVAWTSDFDGDLTTNVDRNIMISTRAPGADVWHTASPLALPIGADTPSIAIQPGGAGILAFVRRGTDGDGMTPTGVISDQAHIYVARADDVAATELWNPEPVFEADGQEARGERPILVGDPVTHSTTGDQEVLLIYRRFGDHTSTAASEDTFGHLVMTQIFPRAFGVPVPIALTKGTRQRWLQSGAIDPLTGRAIVLGVDVPDSTTPSPQDDTLITRTIEAGADPALEQLHVTPAHSAPGFSVSVEVVVRNLGRSTASGMAIDLFAGTPGAGSLLQTIPGPTTLGFNEALTVRGVLAAGSGPQPIYAVVRSTDPTNDAFDTDPSNNIVTGNLRSLSAPTSVNVAPAADEPASLDLTWLAPPEGGTIGYRVVRVHSGTTQADLAGEAEINHLRDRLLMAGETYCYIVTAYDETGVFSPPSESSCGTVSATSSLGTALVGTKLVLKDDPDLPSKRRLVVKSKDPNLLIGPQGGTGDPVLHGATLRIGSAAGNSFDGVYDLPAANWRYLGRAGSSTGYRYRAPKSSGAVEAIQSIVVKPGELLKITGKDAGLSIDLTEDPAPVDLRMTVGDRLFCMRFGGTTKFSDAKTFKAKLAVAPARCPISPAED